MLFVLACVSVVVGYLPPFPRFSGDMDSPRRLAFSSSSLPSVSLDVLDRSAWNARESRCCCPTATDKCNRRGLRDANCCWSSKDKIVLHYPSGNVGNDPLHELRSEQLTHMQDKKQNYCDIAYNFAVSRDGRIFTLRGWDLHSGANGERKSNVKDLAITVLVSEREAPIPDACVNALRLLIAEARNRGWGGSVVPHSSIEHSVSWKSPHKVDKRWRVLVVSIVKRFSFHG
jgi:hypothetical protein